MLPWSILQYFRLALSYHLSLRPSFCLFLSGCLRQVSLYDFNAAILIFQWTDCIVIGRDLVRLLQYVAKLPEFESLWRDILTNPTALSAQFTGKISIHRLFLNFRTSTNFTVNSLKCKLSGSTLV